MQSRILNNLDLYFGGDLRRLSKDFIDAAITIQREIVEDRYWVIIQNVGSLEDYQVSEDAMDTIIKLQHLRVCLYEEGLP